MATGRMLRRTVSTCEQLADCSLLARLLYTWGIAHTSDYGVLKAAPRQLKAQVFPLSDETADDVFRASAELTRCGLWIAFTSDGEDFIYYPTFEKYQDVHKRTGRPRDGLPLPPNFSKCTEVPGTSGDFPEKSGQEKRREEKRRESGAAASQMETQTTDAYQQGLTLYLQALRTDATDFAAEQSFAGVATAYGDEAARDAAIIVLQTFGAEEKKPRPGSVASYLMATARTQAEKAQAVAAANGGTDPILTAFIAAKGRKPDADQFGASIWESELAAYRKREGAA